MTKDDVLRAIDRAWATAQAPSGDNLAGRDVCCGEYTYVAEFFRGKHWRDVDLRSLRGEYPGPHDACLSFMSAEAFRFFLPAYMVIAVEEQQTSDAATDTAIFALAPPRYRPELDELARSINEQVAQEDPDLDVETLHRGSGTSRESVRELRAWWELRVADFTPEQRDAIVAFLEYSSSVLKDDMAGEALEHWRRV